MVNEKRLADITEMLDRGDFEKAFLELLETHDECDNNDDKDAVTHIIRDIFYTPNKEALKANYEKNKTLLAEYPFVWGNDFPSFEELPVTVYPIDNGLLFMRKRTKQWILQIRARKQRIYALFL